MGVDLGDRTCTVSSRRSINAKASTNAGTVGVQFSTHPPICLGGEIGRRSRLRTCRLKRLVGSSPTRGTKTYSPDRERYIATEFRMRQWNSQILQFFLHDAENCTKSLCRFRNLLGEPDIRIKGSLAEWPNAPVLKTGDSKGSVSSNLTASAIFKRTLKYEKNTF